MSSEENITVQEFVQQEIKRLRKFEVYVFQNPAYPKAGMWYGNWIENYNDWDEK